MEVDLKLAMRIAFIVILIWILAAVMGKAPGASVRGPGFSARIGPRSKRKGRWGCGAPRNPFTWKATGMVGDLVQSAGSANAAVGWPMSVF